ncbi:hypothetical protein, partial [Campylobacter sp. 2018MI27]
MKISDIINDFKTYRIDISTKTNANYKVDININKDSSWQGSINKMSWLNENERIGIYIQNNIHSEQLVINCTDKCELKIDILSIDKRNSENTRIPIWLDYYSLKINNEEKLNRLTEVNHDLVKSFYVNYIDRPIIIEFKTRFHQYKYEDLINIL